LAGPFSVLEISFTGSADLITLAAFGVFVFIFNFFCFGCAAFFFLGV